MAEQRPIARWLQSVTQRVFGWRPVDWQPRPGPKHEAHIRPDYSMCCAWHEEVLEVRGAWRSRRRGDYIPPGIL
jgi:hypothetical protein